MFVYGGKWRPYVFTANSGILLATASSISFCVFPIMLGVISRHRELGWRESGWIATALQWGMMAGTLMAYLAGKRQRYRTGLLSGAAGAALSSVLIAATGNIGGLACMVFATGAAAGCVFGIAGTLLARFPRPERNFAIMLGLQALFGSACATSLPFLEARFSSATAEASTAIWFVVIFLMACRWRNLGTATDGRPEDAGTAKPIDLCSVAAVLAIMAFEIAVLTIWLYSDRVGQRSGFAADRIDASIALGNLGGVPAGLLGAVLGDRLGNRLPAIVSTTLAIAAELFILWPPSLSCYVASQLTLNFAWALGLAYYIGVAVKVDDSGRIMRLVPIAVVLASAVAPVCVAALARDGEPGSLAGISIAFGALAIGLTVFGAWCRRPVLAVS